MPDYSVLDRYISYQSKHENCVHKKHQVLWTCLCPNSRSACGLSLFQHSGLWIVLDTDSMNLKLTCWSSWFFANIVAFTFISWYGIACWRTIILAPGVCQCLGRCVALIFSNAGSGGSALSFHKGEGGGSGRVNRIIRCHCHLKGAR